MADALKEGEEKEYVEQALKSGQIAVNEIATVLVIAQLTDTKPTTVQRLLTEKRVGIQQEWRKLFGGIPS